MRKIIAIVLAVVLVAGGLGGFAYAQGTHQPVTGQKLVGVAQLGKTPTGHTSIGVFRFTNPDCVSEIAIQQVSIMRGDGTVIYEGPYLATKIDEDGSISRTPIYGPMKPHGIRVVRLDYLMKNPDAADPDRWLTREEAWELNIAPYTLEVFWTGTKQGCPLTGWAETGMGWRYETPPEWLEGPVPYESRGLSWSQMVNVEQVLMPEKEVTVLRLQTWFQPDDPFMEPLVNFANTVNTQSDLVEVRLYPAVPGMEIADAVKQGEVEMGMIPSGWLAPLSPVVNGGGLPFLYNDDAGLMDAVRGGIGDLMSQELTPHNITVIDWTNIGFSHLFHRTKMLAHPGDVVTSDKIRAVGIQEAAIIEWGGTRVLMPLADMYNALRNEWIDGAALPLHAYDSFRLYEVAPYFCVDNAFAGLIALCINSDVWKKVNANERQIIMEAAAEYVNEMLATVTQVDAAARTRIEGYGVEVYELSSTERADWRLASEPVWYDWAQGVGDVGQQIIDIALAHNP